MLRSGKTCDFKFSRQVRVVDVKQLGSMRISPKKILKEMGRYWASAPNEGFGQIPATCHLKVQPGAKFASLAKLMSLDLSKPNRLTPKSGATMMVYS